MLECDITEVFTAILLFYAIPVTSATAESKTFSKLKIMKTYLKNSMGQARLRHLALIAIENKADSCLDLTVVIDNFSKTKARKRL
ncbi:unnamed protein product [Parnassius mnemosyne]|uniref:HAT C-terminal dimerisation domain-containing protein n=1 Tax=Parnassius mnemosyne TaxID=213953 RepID=A0AAV1LQP1_9NEOP